jgi:hypothetical protein
VCLKQMTFHSQLVYRGAVHGPFWLHRVQFAGTRLSQQANRLSACDCTVEGQRLAARRAAETRRYNQWNKENPPPQECGLIDLFWVVFKLPWFLCFMAYRSVRRPNTFKRGMGSSASQRPAR